MSVVREVDGRTRIKSPLCMLVVSSVLQDPWALYQARSNCLDSGINI